MIKLAFCTGQRAGNRGGKAPEMTTTRRRTRTRTKTKTNRREESDSLLFWHLCVYVLLLPTRAHTYLSLLSIVMLGWPVGGSGDKSV